MCRYQNMAAEFKGVRSIPQAEAETLRVAEAWHTFTKIRSNRCIPRCFNRACVFSDKDGSHAIDDNAIYEEP
jgi:hypothetical protein